MKRSLLLSLFVLLTVPVNGYTQEKTAPLKSGSLDTLKTAPVAKSISLDVPKSLSGPRVSYNIDKSVKIVPKADGSSVEQPFVPIPILFKVGSDELLDETARNNVSLLAAKLREIRDSQAGAKFTIEGHASAEGPAGENLNLSNRRALKILSLLTGTSGLSAAAVTGIGFGEEFAVHPEDADERLLQEDRRVLVVRVE